MQINIEGWLETTYTIPKNRDRNSARFTRYSSLKYDSDTIHKLSTTFKNINRCKEKSKSRRCGKYKKSLITEGDDLTISLQEKGSKYLVDDNGEDELATESLSPGVSKTSRKKDRRTTELPISKSSQTPEATLGKRFESLKTTKTQETPKSPTDINERLRRAALDSFLDSKWCPPHLICHGRSNITRKAQKAKVSSRQIKQLPPPPKVFNIKIQVKSNKPSSTTQKH